MTDITLTANNHEEIIELFKLVDGLPLEKQIELLCQYSGPYLPSMLFQLIIHLSDAEKQSFLNEVKEPCSDKRTSDRKECFIVTDYVVNERLHKDFVKDISESGVFIETNRPYEGEVGDKMVQSFSLLDEQILFKFTGEIVRIDQKGIGVKFLNLTPYQVEMIRNVMKKAK